MEKTISKYFRKYNSSFFILSILFLSSFQLSLTTDKSVNQSEGPNQNCMLITDKTNNNTLYDLYDLSKQGTKTKEINDANIKAQGIYRINYTLCKNVYESSSVIGIDSNGSVITRLAGNVHGEVNSKSKITYNKNNGVEYVTIYLPKGDKCIKNGNEYYTFKIKLTCKPEIEFENDQLTSSDPCILTLEANSKYACGKEGYYSDIFEGIEIIIGIALCIFGNLLGILGYKFLNIAFLLSCMAALPILIKFVLTDFLPIENNIVLYVLMGVGFIIGAIIAIILLKKHKFVKVYMSIIGGITGFLIGIFLCDILMALIQTSHHHLIRTVITIVFIIIGVVLGIFLSRKVCIFGTSVLGAYAFMKGISLFLVDIADYIDERKIYDLSRTGNFEQIEKLMESNKFFIYPVLWIVFTIAYIITQHFINPKIDDCEDYKELEGKFGSIFGEVRIDTEGSNERSIRDERIMEDF